MPRFVRLFVILMLGLLSATSRAAGEVDFSSHIRPILSDNCFACHGPDEGDRQGGFRLDVAESAMAEADSGERPIVPGDAEASELIRRILSDDESMHMPPAETHNKITAEELEKLKAWINAGAIWEQHWSLQPVKRPELPKLAQEPDWAKNEIDQFILARLQAEHLTPAEQADKATLLRRVTFDLTGLPPTPEQLDAFLADDSSDAYERVVDRLLATSQYGEHMGRFWLDAARYADTHGLHLDNFREMWLYRDWVIEAFNQDMPFDQFAVEQIAGDLLPNPSEAQLIATGFNRCHVTTNEGGSIKEEVHIRNVIDRVDTFSTVFLGLTMACTRCHDHKYDPLTQRDYYSMSAFFNSLDSGPMDGNKKVFGPHVKHPSEEQQAQLAALGSEVKELTDRLAADWPEADAAQQAWLAKVTNKAGGKLKDLGNGKGHVTIVGDKFTLHPWHLLGYFNADPENEILDQVLPPEKDGFQPKRTYASPFGAFHWKQRNDYADGVVNVLPKRDSVATASYVYRKIEAKQASPLKIALGSNDAVKVFLNGKEVFRLDVRRVARPDQNKLTLNLNQGTNHLLIKVVNYLGETGFYFGVPEDNTIAPPEILEIAAVPQEKRTDEQRTKLRSHFRANVTTLPEVVEVRVRLADAEKELTDLQGKVPTTLIWKEAAKPRKAHMLNRGEYDQRGEVVSRAVPKALPPLGADLPNNRLGLAQWLTDPGHPLFARVAVNRLWQQAFGTGLVKTAGDFGSQGEPPSHPELLDWLAADFIEHDWEVKRLMKQLVMSATYRQSSHVTPELVTRDPENRLLARGPRYRLDAEMLRDQALSVSGLLSHRMGGPSVKPPQPGGIWEAVAYSGSNTKTFRADKSPEKVHRRTLYTFIKRTAPAPQMNTFDAPSRESCTVVRERTNTPLQALLILNDPQFVEAARGLAQRSLLATKSANKSETNKPEETAQQMFRMAVGRPARDQEVAELVASYQEDLAHFRNNPQAAEQLIQVGTNKPDAKIDPAELAAWTLTANMILNMDEVVTKN